MKGVTPIIAIILLLLITISMVGFAFVWFTSIAESSTEAVGGQLEATTEQIAKKIRIDNIAGTSLALRATGTATIELGELGFFIDGVAVNCIGFANIAPNSVGICTLDSACNIGSRLRVSAPGGPDEVTC